VNGKIISFNEHKCGNYLVYSMFRGVRLLSGCV